MKKTMLATTACMLGGLALAGGQQRGATAKPEAVTIAAKDVKWGPAPPTLPAGAQVAVMHGDPGKKGPFALRMKMPDGYNTVLTERGSVPHTIARTRARMIETPQRIPYL